jgi:hypothetical protein
MMMHVTSVFRRPIVVSWPVTTAPIPFLYRCDEARTVAVSDRISFFTKT